MNSTIIDCFNKLILIEKQKTSKSKNANSTFRINSYKKTIKLIESLDFIITKGDQLKSFKGVGAKTIEKIDTIIETGTLPQLKELKKIDISSQIKHKECEKLQQIGK